MALEAERLSIGLARGVHLCCVINCIYHVEGLPFTPDLLKRFSPKSSSNSSPKWSLPFPPRRLYFDHRVLHHHCLGPLALPQLPVVARWRWGWSRTTSTQLVRATRSGNRWRFTRALHGVVVRRPSAASTGVGGSWHPAWVREGHPQSRSCWWLDIVSCKT
jgi:hypothetical protein